MERDTAKNLGDYKTVHTFTDCQMHSFVERLKTRVAEGNCFILESHPSGEQLPIYYLKMNGFDFYKQISSNLFVRVRYEKSTSYLFFDEGNNSVVYSVTFSSRSPDIPVLEEIVGNSGKLADYQSPDTSYEVKVRIDFHCEKVLENEIAINHNSTAKIGKAIGNFFGFISSKFTSPVREAEKTINTKVERFSRESFSDETRSKWSTIKEKAASFNDKMTDIIKPIGDKLSETKEFIGHSYQQSNNKYVKSFRELMKETQNSINEGYWGQDKEPKEGEPRIELGEEKGLSMRKGLVS